MIEFGTEEWYKEHPIFWDKEKFKNNTVTELLEEIRMELAELRGKVSDISYANRQIREQTRDFEGCLTMLISSLYSLQQRIKNQCTDGT